jgi:hypothetical protein
MPSLAKAAVLVLIATLAFATCAAQLAPPPAPEAPPADAGWTDWLGGANSPRLRARLTAPAPDQHTAGLEVEVQNVFLNSPVVPTNGVQQGMLRYQVDHCPPILTTDTRLQFSGLASGTHSISVAVVGIGNGLLTPEARLQAKIP